MKTKTLTTKATDNHGYSYTVILTETARPDFTKLDWVLKITTTPGSWYMTTLEERPTAGSIISIDFGAKWDCTNFDAILAEAQAILALEAPNRLTATETKAQDDQMWARMGL